MGGYYATTDREDPDSFDPRPLKVGDELWTILWRNGDHGSEPTILYGKVSKIEQTGFKKDRDRVEETWLLEFENDTIGHRYFYLGDRLDGAFSNAFFWTSKEAVEAAAREGIQNELDGFEEELRDMQKRVDGLRASLTAPLNYETED